MITLILAWLQSKAATNSDFDPVFLYFGTFVLDLLIIDAIAFLLR